MNELIQNTDGVLLIHKHAGVSSFGIIELLQEQLITQKKLKRKDFPKLGHGGTLDPFATGLLAVCVGRAVKLARYFLGATKSYQGVILFGQTTVPGDPTAPVSEVSEILPENLAVLQTLAGQLAKQPYLQTPPMHSAKKKNGKPLYELARAGIEVEREPKLCHLYQFEILSYEKPRAVFKVTCSSGTYIRTLAQDFARLLGSVGMLESLSRTGAGPFSLENALGIEEIGAATANGSEWKDLTCWVPFDRLLDGYDCAHASTEETEALFHGKQNVLFNILKRSKPTRPLTSSEQDSCLAIFSGEKLVAIARKEGHKWGVERVFHRKV